MRFILSNWTGFEIDSSEYSTVIALKNPVEGITALINSSEISSFSLNQKCLENIEKSLQMVESEKIHTKIDIDFKETYTKIRNLRQKDLSKKDIIWITKISNKIVKIYPYLTFEFLDSTITLTAKESNISSTISLIGLPMIESTYQGETAKDTFEDIVDLID